MGGVGTLSAQDDGKVALGEDDSLCDVIGQLVNTFVTFILDLLPEYGHTSSTTRHTCTCITCCSLWPEPRELALALGLPLDSDHNRLPLV